MRGVPRTDLAVYIGTVEALPDVGLVQDEPGHEGCPVLVSTDIWAASTTCGSQD